jgi:hypothetical protein
MRPASLFAVFVIAALAIPAFAQAPPAAPPTFVRGTFVTLEGHTLTVKSRDGNSVTVILAPNFTVRGVATEQLSDIKPGDKVGITSVGAPNGSRQAIEITVFPASMTNVRPSEFPSNLVPGSLMTNAIVAQVTSAPQGRSIKVTLNGMERDITVPPETPIVTYTAGDPALLKPGAAVVVVARKQPDGSLGAAGITAEKDGVKPPM